MRSSHFNHTNHTASRTKAAAAEAVAEAVFKQAPAAGRKSAIPDFDARAYREAEEARINAVIARQREQRLNRDNGNPPPQTKERKRRGNPSSKGR